MTGAENPIRAATRIFDESIYAIRDSNITGLNDAAHRTVDRISKMEILVVGNNPDYNIPTVTGFDLTELAPGPSAKYFPSVVIDLDKIIGSSAEVVKGDLARTIAIADQYPFNGFERRYKEVYKQALGFQLSWLENTNNPNIPLDPRDNEQESLLRQLLGDARYYSDVGFSDWQAAIKDYKNSGQDVAVNSKLNQLIGDKAHFLVMRQRFVPMNHMIASQQAGENYTSGWDEEKRSQAIAYTLMGASLYASNP